jgi:hypothetical protein
MKFLKLYILIFILSFIHAVHAQSGGPPMITDDPCIVEFHKFEINTSINPSIMHQQMQLAVPYIDANYGIAKHMHLKIEFPFFLNYGKNIKTHYSFGYLMVGLKIKFFEENKYFMSAGTYPQWTATGDSKGFLLPLLLEKTFGKFLIGEDIGMFFGQNNIRTFSNGILLGYKASKRVEVMGEYFFENTLSQNIGADGYMNYGFRYALKSHINLMGSFGTQLVTAAGNNRQQFFSWLGIQTDF